MIFCVVTPQEREKILPALLGRATQAKSNSSLQLGQDFFFQLEKMLLSLLQRSEVDLKRKE